MARTCTLKGKSLELEGPQLKPGDSAPDVKLKASLVEQTSIGETNGRVRILSVVPSLDRANWAVPKFPGSNRPIEICKSA